MSRLLPCVALMVFALLAAAPVAAQSRPDVGPGGQQGAPDDDRPPEDGPTNPCAGMADGTRCPDDGTVCTRDVCRAEQCRHEPAREDHACEDDGNECTDDICSGGACTHPIKHNETPCSDDGNPCTADQCLRGHCQHFILPAGTVCAEDGEPCTSHTCNDRAQCVRSVAVDGAVCPSDGDCCTYDYCESGRCIHRPVTHGDPCQEDEGCRVSGICLRSEGKVSCFSSARTPQDIGACPPPSRSMAAGSR